jgi:hypothetical protein
MFIQHILGVGSPHKRLYGDTAAYYGTVEQQGKLTLHLHMLLWIKGAVALKEIQRCIKDPNTLFSESLVKYLESCHAGEFITGSKEAAFKNVELMMALSEYKNPTETMPVPPPPLCTQVHCKSCNKCTALASWTKEYQNTVDDLLLKSNVHICTTNRNKDGTQNRLHSFTGCLDNIWQKCKACFPRPLFQYTEVGKNSVRGTLEEAL